MKKVLVLMVTAMLGMANASAQKLFAEPENQLLDQTLTESVEQNIINASLFEDVKDASFLTENELLNVMDQLKKDPDQLTAGLLAILLGGIGVQHFYTGQTLRGVLDILFCWTGIPAIIGLIEGIVWLCDDEAEWAERVAKWNSK